MFKRVYETFYFLESVNVFYFHKNKPTDPPWQLKWSRLNSSAKVSRGSKSVLVKSNERKWKASTSAVFHAVLLIAHDLARMRVRSRWLHSVVPWWWFRWRCSPVFSSQSMRYPGTWDGSAPSRLWSTASPVPWWPYMATTDHLWFVRVWIQVNVCPVVAWLSWDRLWRNVAFNFICINYKSK